MPGPALAGLVDARVQAEIGDQTIRSGEPLDGTDRGDEPDRDHHVDARDRHQPLDVRVAQSITRQLALNNAQVLAEPVVLTQVPGDCVALVGRERLGQEPRPSPRPKQISVRTGRHEVGVQDRLRNRLQPRPLPHDLCAARDLSS